MSKTFVHIVDEPAFYNKVQVTVEDAVLSSFKEITASKPSRSLPKYLTARQVCEALSISRSTLHRRVVAGVIPCHKEGRSRRFLPSEVEASLLSVNANTVRGYDYK